MLPGGGVDMTLSELQEMAARQQQQIKLQQHILVAKEQHLKHLKQQEQKQQQLASENERLRKLRDRVEAQEFKLKKLRALRGQVEQQKASNGNLNYELESMKVLFNEKEKELSAAVAKVEEMSQQLEEIRSGRIRSSTNTQSPVALAELEKLKKELKIRNKLNEQQNTKMAMNRELLSRRKDELARMDKRIHELQICLKKKKATNREMSEKGRNQVNKPILNNVLHHPAANMPDVNVNNVNSGFAKQDPKYLALPNSSKINYLIQMNPIRETNNNNITYPAKQYNDSKSDEYSIPLVISIDSANKTSQNGSSPSSQQSPVTPTLGNLPISTLQTPQSLLVSAANNSRFGTAALARSGLSHFAPKPYRSIYSSAIVAIKGTEGILNDQLQLDGHDDVRQAGSGQSSPESLESLNESLKPITSYTQVLLPMVQREQINQGPEMETQPKGRQLTAVQMQSKGPPPIPNRTVTLPSEIYHLNNSALVPSISKTINGALNSQDNISDTEETNISVSKGIQKFSVLIAQQNKDDKRTDGTSVNSGGFSHLNHASALGAMRPAPTYRYASKSVIANTYFSKMNGETLEQYQKNVLSLHRDHNESNKSEEGSTLETEKQVEKIPDENSVSPVASQNSPLSTSSTPSAAIPSMSSNYPFDYPSSAPLADVASDKVSYKPNTPKNIRRRHSDSDNEEVSKALHKFGINRHVNNILPVQENQLLTLINNPGTVEVQATAFNNQLPETVMLDNRGHIVEVLDNSDETVNNSEDVVNDTESFIDNARLSLVAIEVKSSELTVKKKSNLKTCSSRRSNCRVSFDPLVLLLDASLEGELDVVHRCAHQVENVSASNDEGITALHNAICAGHYDIVTCLVEFGCDVNSPDTDGWTPLHCAASCNNLPMVKFLVEHGACIFATTISNHETAAEKCEEEEDGYEGCTEYLYSIQEKLGIMNDGTVYAVFDYTRENSDELDLCIGDLFMVLRKGDEKEKEWWWAKKGNQEGYIPRNLLGLTPRVLPKADPERNV